MVYNEYRLCIGGIFIGKKLVKVYVNEVVANSLTEYAIKSGETVSHIVRKAIIMFLKYKGVLKL